MKGWKQGKWHVDRPGNFRCSAACNLFTFFLQRKPWDCLHDIARSGSSTSCIIMIPTRAAWRSFFKFLVGYFRERLFPVRAIRANGSLELACRESHEPRPSGRLIKTDRRTPAPTTTVDVQARVSAFTNHYPVSLQRTVNQAEVPL